MSNKIKLIVPVNVNRLKQTILLGKTLDPKNRHMLAVSMDNSRQKSVHPLTQTLDVESGEVVVTFSEKIKYKTEMLVEITIL